MFENDSRSLLLWLLHIEQTNMSVLPLNNVFSDKGEIQANVNDTVHILLIILNVRYCEWSCVKKTNEIVDIGSVRKKSIKLQRIL